MESPSLKEKNIIKYVRHFSRLEKLKKETIDTTVNEIRNHFGLEKENGEITDRILRDIRNTFWLEKQNTEIKDIILRNLFENEEGENYYEPVRASKF